MIINRPTEYIDEDGVVYNYKELKDNWDYEITKTEKHKERNERFNQDIRLTRHFIRIRGRRPKQQTLF